MEEHSPFMMGYVIITKQNNAVVIDGGRPEDVPHLLSLVAGRKIKGWFLTHPHDDHITAFQHIMDTMPEKVDVEKVYYHFPPYAMIAKYESYEQQTRLDFCYLEQKLGDKAVCPRTGDHIQIDELDVEILMTYCPYMIQNLINDSSMVFRVTGEKKSVLFLGDIGPEAGDELMRLQHGNLHADFVQMAHHGHMCCGPEVYMEVAPEACLWNAPDWLYAESTFYIRPRMYGEATTRLWMDKMGVKNHYVTKDGTQKFII